MPEWSQPPVSEWDLLTDYVGEHYAGTSLACDSSRRVTHIANEGMTQPEFDAMVAALQLIFPSAFS